MARPKNSSIMVSCRAQGNFMFSDGVTTRRVRMGQVFETNLERARSLGDLVKMTEPKQQIVERDSEEDIEVR